ncbi:DNA repair protein SWI5 [Merluccius polli]|uniref:DNA repair protein SWI5 homolog n=1 Tax=Merluccius polli TaxID=89951 RepID=A0AA47NPH4_MERPO|nr:DNA repair protein SWI5 [Merluccius polli]
MAGSSPLYRAFGFSPISGLIARRCATHPWVRRGALATRWGQYPLCLEPQGWDVSTLEDASSHGATVESCLVYEDVLMWDCMSIHFQYSLKTKNKKQHELRAAKLRCDEELLLDAWRETSQHGSSEKAPERRLQECDFLLQARADASQCTKITPEEEVNNLKRRLKELDAEIDTLVAEGYRLEELGQHIDLLHEYNDIKDIGQTLLGHIAARRGTTTRELYGHFGLELND